MTRSFSSGVLGLLVLATVSAGAGAAQVYPVRLDEQRAEPQPAATTPPSLVLGDGGLEFPDGTVLTTAGQSDLVRIVALSWNHAGVEPLVVTIDGHPLFGVIVGFGLASVDDGGAVDSADLDDESVQLFFDQPSGSFKSSLRIPTTVAPVVNLVVDAGDSTIVQAQTTPGALATGVAALLTAGIHAQIPSGARIRAVVVGDFIRDQTSRAIDAEFTRAELPTGDRPAGASLGIEGGRFESYFNLQTDPN